MQKTSDVSRHVVSRRGHSPQEAWARKAFPTLSYFNEVDRGGHFAMWEYPELFAEELRAAFKPLR